MAKVNKKSIERGRDAFQQRAWADAYHQLSKADKEAPLKPEDLELLATAAYLVGKTSESNDIWSRAHHDYLNLGKIELAVRCAFLLGFALFHKGEYARGGGWFTRARTLLEENPFESVEEGYLLLPLALQSLSEEDAKSSLAIFEQAGQIADQYRDRDLMALTRLGRGQALVLLKETRAGVALLDESMAAVDSGEISPIFVGIIYCAVIECCLGIFDLKRAHQWTDALRHWCNAQPQLVPFRGECLVRRSEILQMRGEWPKAIEEARKAKEILTKSITKPATGAAFYQFGELQRLRGEFTKAEKAYHQANRWGRRINPGLSLLRLAQGKVNTAKKSIEVAIKEATNLKNRYRILPAYIEIMLAAKNTLQARKAADELLDVSNNFNTALINALAARGEGAVLLYEGKFQKALIKLRHSWTIFEHLGVPYEIAKIRVLLGRAYQLLGDKDTAKMELKAAKSAFQKLGANPDINHVDSLLKTGNSCNIHGLSQRELEVLGQIALGLTNQIIADELCISKRTVERHVSNIFSKLNVSSRSALTAYAYEHQLV